MVDDRQEYIFVSFNFYYYLNKFNLFVSEKNEVVSVSSFS